MDVDRLEFDANMARSLGHLLWTRPAACRWIVEYAKALGTRKQLFQHFDFLRVEFGRKDTDARHVATRPRQAGGEPGVHRSSPTQTIGSVLVAACAARPAASPYARMTVAPSCTNASASPGSRSSLPSARRMSRRTF